MSNTRLRRLRDFSRQIPPAKRQRDCRCIVANRRQNDFSHRACSIIFDVVRLLIFAGRCKRGGTGGTDGTAGPQGPAGLTGPQGPSGPQGQLGTARAWAWVSANGSIVNSGGSATIHVIKPNLTTGVYCLQTTPNILSNYGAILATRQGPDLSPGFINANNGWGSTCNPYGGYGVFTSNAQGTATDEAFVVVIP